MASYDIDFENGGSIDDLLGDNTNVSQETIAAINAILKELSDGSPLDVGSSDGTNFTLPVSGEVDLLVLNIKGSAGQTVQVSIPANVLSQADAYVFNTFADVVVSFNTVDRVIAMGMGNDTVFVGGNRNTQLDGNAGNDKLTTTGGADIITGGAGDDLMSSGLGDDILITGIGNDTIDGGGGYDIVRVQGAASEFTMASSGTNIVLTGKAAGSATVTFTNTEFLQFTTGGAIALTTSAREAAVLRMYDGLLDRQVDSTGAQFWINLVTNKGLSLSDAALGFMNSPEFQAEHASLSNEGFIRLMYQNSLSRQPEAAGMEYYLQAMNAGESRGDIAAKIIGSPESADGNPGVQLVTGWV